MFSGCGSVLCRCPACVYVEKRNDDEDDDDALVIADAKHWNSVHPEPFGDVPWSMFLELIDHSYALVWKGLTRKVKMAIEETQTR